MSETRTADEFIGNIYANKFNEKVEVVGGSRKGGYLWLKCQCKDCGSVLDKPVRHTNLEHGKFVCPLCHPERHPSQWNIGDSQPYRFNITQKNNTSGYVGVDYVKKHKKWRARLNYNKKCYNIGLYDTPEEAHTAREKKRYELGLVNINKFTKENNL